MIDQHKVEKTKIVRLAKNLPKAKALKNTQGLKQLNGGLSALLPFTWQKPCVGPENRN